MLKTIPVQCAHCEECEILGIIDDRLVKIPEGWVVGTDGDDKVVFCCSEDCSEAMDLTVQ